jgi:RNA polymerase sigma-70 factor, ECF subfamily
LVYVTGRVRLAPVPDDGDHGRAGLDLLLVAAAQREHGAFDLVYEQLSSPVYGAIRVVLHDPAQAEEVAQEVLLEIWQLASRYDPRRGGAAAWAFTIARRRAVDRVRATVSAAARERRTAAVPGQDRDEVGDIVEETLEHERLRRCLDRLSSPQREAIILAFYGGYTYLQVASMQGVPVSTVKSRIREGLARLRDGMQDAAVSPRPRAGSMTRTRAQHQEAAPVGVMQVESGSALSDGIRLYG